MSRGADGACGINRHNGVEVEPQGTGRAAEQPTTGGVGGAPHELLPIGVSILRGLTPGQR